MSDFDTCLAHLTGAEPPRVWSLIVTIFGDLAPDPSDRLSAALLGQITAPLGIKPESLRVALHRLRKDGWIGAERQGRGSLYHLTDRGRRETRDASPRIYGPRAPSPEIWHVLIAPAGGKLPPPASGAISLGPCAQLRPGPIQDAPSELLALQGDLPQIPDWLKTQICPPELSAASQQLLTRLTALDDTLKASAPLTPPQIATLRVLVVHSWRRIILRRGDLPGTLCPDSWQGPACRSLTQSLLSRLPRPSLDALAP